MNQSSTVPESAVLYDSAEQSLLDAINSFRSQTSRPPLKVSPKLTKLARAESNSAASAMHFRKGETAQLRLLSGFNSIGTLNGTLKDRGTQTSSSFVDYWKQDPAKTLTGEWSHVGIGISKSADGRLFAYLIFGDSRMKQNVSLMPPALMPRGF